MTIEFYNYPAGGHGPLAPSFTPFKFKGGEMHIKGSTVTHHQTENFGDVPHIQIAYLRGADSDDLFALAMWASLDEVLSSVSVLFLPYLPAARADKGQPFGAGVYASFIDSLGIDHIFITDPHSHVAPELYWNSKIHTVPIHKYMAKVLPSLNGISTYRGIIAPDKGAVERATLAAKELGGLEVFWATKERDQETGHLTLKSVPDLPEGRYLIVDDICDGGGTFIQLADALNLNRDNLDLWVTHGIFSKGLDELRTRFGEIYTTDSHPGVDATEFSFSATVQIRELLPIFMREAFYLAKVDK